MSDIIQLLPDSVANQIAAGEVIQRPASVIKELVENSVDAGAQHIQVVVIDAGRTLIQVVDDGKGMSETDARLAFERHATSKIRKADDLFDLHTMGFRGEALPSIAAVAQVELTTRLEGEDIGTKLVLNGSRVVSQEPVASPVGSNFRVENIFFNVPARRKFLKTNSTELSNILTAFERIVLVYPSISFTLYSNGQELMNLKAGSLRQRIVDVFGKKLNQDLLPVDVDTAICRISGFVGKPESARKKGAQTYFFVNGRFMKHSYFHKAVTNAFERLVPEGMLVPYFLYFDVAPTDIDVNIHPTKTEIKFENEQSIWQILTAAVKDAIGRFCEVPAIDFDTEERPEIPVFNPERNAIEMPKVTYNPDYNPFKSTSKDVSAPKGWEALYPEPLFPEEKLVEKEEPKLLIEDKSPAHYQYKGTYIMTAVRSGLMIIDQHRADVRIRYEYYLHQLSQRQSRTQQLLFPEVVQLTAAESVILSQIIPQLVAVGFDLSDLGGGSYAVAGVPAGLEGINPVSVVKAIVVDAMEQKTTVVEHLNSTLALSLARQAAIPQGQVLSNEEMEHVVNQLFACDNVNYTPDGKPILSILPHGDIEHMFR
ncbi:DNA mismatch repair endonuclease MutL [Prevotella sp. E13-27]|uniref:DNA mismatch repair endonuclease MutL n=1 Tax=Prevotella sp. E13-27 TaxID=2938122 RepID=UPI00200B54FC|nr:DNA mismatch repair endonuclease MutL [Prevotella sp. E13-27]MCK8623858.1 DNA mismatch repair endonuclease MutL [Prevotella sp. E13-27]